jgi:hypothetical protein
LKYGKQTWSYGKDEEKIWADMRKYGGKYDKCAKMWHVSIRGLNMREKLRVMRIMESAEEV